jgi:hypothetical protein
MKPTVQLTITSLLSILFLTLHLTQDILYGMAQPGLSSLVVAVPVLVLWLYGTLVLAERRSGYIIILVGSLVGLGVSVIHFRGPSGVLNAEHLKSQRSIFLHMDASRARRKRDVLRRPFGARIDSVRKGASLASLDGRLTAERAGAASGP